MIRRIIPLLAVIIGSSVFAGTSQMKCPSIESIRVVGLQDVNKVILPKGSHWQGTSISQFDTMQTWTFRIMNFKDKLKETAEEAMQNLTMLLGDMKLKAGPAVVDGMVYCAYYNKDYTVKGTAITSAI